VTFHVKAKKEIQYMYSTELKLIEKTEPNRNNTQSF